MSEAIKVVEGATSLLPKGHPIIVGMTMLRWEGMEVVVDEVISQKDNDESTIEITFNGTVVIDKNSVRLPDRIKEIIKSATGADDKEIDEMPNKVLLGHCVAGNPKATTADDIIFFVESIWETKFEQ